MTITSVVSAVRELRRVCEAQDAASFEPPGVKLTQVVTTDGRTSTVRGRAVTEQTKTRGHGRDALAVLRGTVPGSEVVVTLHHFQAPFVVGLRADRRDTVSRQSVNRSKGQVVEEGGTGVEVFLVSYVLTEPTFLVGSGKQGVLVTSQLDQALLVDLIESVDVPGG